MNRYPGGGVDATWLPMTMVCGEIAAVCSLQGNKRRLQNKAQEVLGKINEPDSYHTARSDAIFPFRPEGGGRFLLDFAHAHRERKKKGRPPEEATPLLVEENGLTLAEVEVGRVDAPDDRDLFRGGSRGLDDVG